MYKYFALNEFDCKCGCRMGTVSAELITLLDMAREIMGCPLIISSGFRCPTHNEAVGGVKNSYHTLGMAADIIPSDGDIYRLAEVLKQLRPVSGIIIYKSKGFVHFDIRNYIYHNTEE